jgi:P27 family predicted phage terminase small subunit
MGDAMMPLPAAPEGLSAAAGALWDRLAGDLDTARRGAAEVDFLALEEVLRAWDRLAEVRAVLAEDGVTTDGSQGQTRPHPLLNVERTLSRVLTEGLRDLGMTKRSYLVAVSSDGRLVAD